MWRVFSRIVRAVVPAVAVTLAACSSETASPTVVNEDPATVPYAASLGVNIAQMTQRVPGLYVQDVAVGTGLTATNGRSLSMHYTGWLANGRQFDSSRGGSPLPFSLGVGEVIRGWDLGIEGMRVGGRRRLVIGPDLGYGARGNGPIPGGAVLVFDVELLAVR
ncbi:MAG: FKBP-type peptidyl-prolyl cis-trans isomerase [Gemmatimonadaceae bacterium]|jgi:peptidylprolyl isomerase|nr:FKBP-type peptidyl-prolyl cis-trans isomerase [Gemmatimonadaceae bacterium]